jgi:hypothetical protein
VADEISKGMKLRGKWQARERSPWSPRPMENQTQGLEGWRRIQIQEGIWQCLI